MFCPLALTLTLVQSQAQDQGSGLTGVEKTHRYHWYSSQLCSVLKVAEDSRAGRIHFLKPKDARGYQPCEECMFLSGSLVITTKTAIGNCYHWQPKCHFLEVIDGPKSAPLAPMLLAQSEAVRTGFRPCEVCLSLSKVPGTPQ